MQTFKPNPGQLRAIQLLRGAQRHTLLAGGARSGKTFLLVRAIVVRALRGAGSRHAILRYRANAARSSIALDTLPKVMGLCFPGVRLVEHRQDGYFELPNGSQIWIGGLDDKERVEKILGQEYATLYLNECSQIPYSSVLIARTRLAQTVEGLRQRAYYDLNPGGSGHWTNHEFGKSVDPVSRQPLAEPDDFKRCFINPDDNAENLSPEFLRSLATLPEKQRKRFYEGRYVDDVDGALWTYEGLEKCRIDPGAVRVGYRRIVVAVDPSGTAGAADDESRSDDVGIMVVANGGDGVAYVLADRTCNLSPAGWGRAVVDAFHEFGADRIVAERNFGGAMVESVIRSAANEDGRPVAVKLVSASRGKTVRAEPVAALYEQNLVRHVGRFPDLEDQLVNFSTAGYVGDKSPDRADALVWALTELKLGATNGDVFTVPLSDIEVLPFRVPDFWPRAYAIDVGHDRVSVVWGAWDITVNALYLFAEYHATKDLASTHAAAIKARGEWVKGVVVPQAHARSKEDGEQLTASMRKAGLKLTAVEDAIEASVEKIGQDLAIGQIKVFTTLGHLKASYGMFRRDDKGRLPDTDTMMNAMRMLVMHGPRVASVRPAPDLAGYEPERMGDSLAGY